MEYAIIRWRSWAAAWVARDKLGDTMVVVPTAPDLEKNWQKLIKAFAGAYTEAYAGPDRVRVCVVDLNKYVVSEMIRFHGRN